MPAPTELCAAQHAFLERTRALVSSDEAAQARAEIAATRARWAVRGTAIAHDATSWDAERALARRQLQTRLAAVLAGYAELRKAQRSHFAALFTKAQLPLPALDPHVVLPADPELIQYRSPFSLERRGPLSAGWLNTMQVQDRSFARREIGHLVVDADLSVNPDATWGLNELFGLVPLHQAWLSVACGTVFTPASTGRLMIAAGGDRDRLPGGRVGDGAGRGVGAIRKRAQRHACQRAPPTVVGPGRTAHRRHCLSTTAG